MVRLTRHGYERSKERTTAGGVKAATERAEKAYWCGKSIEDFAKQVQKYLRNVLQRSSGDDLKVLGNDVYIFGGETLITTFPLSQKILKDNKKKERVYYEEDI